MENNQNISCSIEKLRTESKKIKKGWKDLNTNIKSIQSTTIPKEMTNQLYLFI